MVKRIQHIGPFLRNEMGVSLRGMSPMCDHSSIHLSENLFLKVYSHAQENLELLVEADVGLMVA
jgi:hypothetical protein